MITTLVPAFKPEFFGPLLTCLAQQSRRPARVVISDDTPEGDFSAAARRNEDIRSALGRINGVILKGPRRGYHENVRFLLAEYRTQATEFFHILLDDDAIMPSFYSDHLEAHDARRAICCVSRRVIGFETGRMVLPDLPFALQELRPGLARVDLEQMVRSFIIEGKPNWLGELSCMTLRRGFLDLEPDFNSLGGIGLEGSNDICTLLKSAIHGEVICLTEPKGMFRQNASNISSRRGYFFSLTRLVYIPIAIVLQRLSHVTRDDVSDIVARVGRRWLSTYGANAIHELICELQEMIPKDYAAFERRALDFWAAYRRLAVDSSRMSTRATLLSYLAGMDPSQLGRSGALT